jgi:hypothetical protein
MAELIAGVVEAIVGLVTAFCEALPVILEGLFYLFSASVMMIAWLVSPRLREKKRQEWASRPAKKYLELGIGAACLATLIGLVGWLVWPNSGPKRGFQTVRGDETNANEDMRLRIKATTAGGRTNDLTVAVKKGGTRKILETESVDQLVQAIRENVAIVQTTNELVRSNRIAVPRK